MEGRRTFLKSIAGVTTVGAVGTAVASADETVNALGAGRPGNDDGLAIEATGEMVGRIEPSDSGFVHRKEFHSEDLAEHYGDPVMEYEPATIPAEFLSYDVRHAGGTTYRYETTRVVGRPDEQNRSEVQILREAQGDVTTFGDPTDAVPLFSYSSSSDARQRLTDRASPINLAWSEGPATKVQEWMQEFGWTQSLQWIDEYTVDQYVNQDGDLIETTCHVMDEDIPGMTISPMQDHIRVYDLNGTPSDVAVVGQIHHDPFDHNKIGENVGEIPRGSWEFEASRERATDLWTDESSSYRKGESDQSADTNLWNAGNTHDGTDSHDGYLAEIENDGFGIPEDDCGIICTIPIASDGETENENEVASTSTSSLGARRPCSCTLGF